jgi:glucan 1,3-beta-glucosidase
MFASNGASAGHPVPELGYKGPWAKIRAAEHAQAKGASNLWEFGPCILLFIGFAIVDLLAEHGFKQGIDSARADFAQTYC